MAIGTEPHKVEITYAKMGWIDVTDSFGKLEVAHDDEDLFWKWVAAHEGQTVTFVCEETDRVKIRVEF